MSPLWQIPELVHIVLELLSREDQGRMAQVCRTFWVNVLPLIWRDVPQFDYVIRLFPEDSVTTETKNGAVQFRIKRTLHDADWERVLLHTQYTTKIGVLIYDDLLDFTSNLPSKPVFPALRRIRIGVTGGVKVPSVELIKVFLPSHVSSIEIDIHSGPAASTEAVLNFIANDISLPELTSFSIATFFFGCGPAISQAILSHRNIQSLTVILVRNASETARILQSAAGLPHLSHISINDFSVTGNQGPNIRLIPRESLIAVTDLDVIGDLTFVDAVLGLPVVGNMESLCCGITALGRDGTPFANCLHSIGQFTRLECLELKLEIQVPWSAVSMLVGCRELEVFRVVTTWWGSLDITEADLERMSDALPRLQELTLKSLDVYAEGISHIPIHHLHRIATRFRTLRKLCVCVDATAEGNPMFNWTAPEAVANEALEELDVASSKVDPEAKVIATMFRTWWPRLRLVKWDDSQFGPFWAEVNAIVCCESR